jgi:uncharacterized membrane protein
VLKYLAAYLGTGLAFAAADAVWLTQVGPRLYRPTLDPVLADQVAPAPAVAFYLIYVLGLVFLAVLPAAREGAGWTRAAVNGAALGAVAYGAYDLTNQATLKVWATKITLADMSWGAFASALGAVAGWFAFRAVQRAFG